MADGWLSSLFGNEQERFARGIKARRIKKAIYEDQGIPEPKGEDLIGPSVGMTRYLMPGISKTGKVPDIAKRIKGTEIFKMSVGNIGPSARTAASMFAERYPRVAAHMGAAGADLTGKIKGLTGIGKRVPEVPEMTPVAIRKNMSPRDIENTLLHEGTHVAQELGMPQKGRLPAIYDASKKALRSMGMSADDAYELNPYEVSARTVAQRKMGENIPAFMTKPAIDMLVDELPIGSLERIKLASLRRR